jgi:hypothetical protein
MFGLRIVATKRKHATLKLCCLTPFFFTGWTEDNVHSLNHRTNQPFTPDTNTVTTHTHACCLDISRGKRLYKDVFPYS